jgi:glycerol-3-phosphate dehydrogenase
LVLALALPHPLLPPSLSPGVARGSGACVAPRLGGGYRGEVGAPGVCHAELRSLRDHDWARSADDVLWRRTKLGLHYDAGERSAVADWCARHVPQQATAPEQAWN